MASSSICIDVKGERCNTKEVKHPQGTDLKACSKIGSQKGAMIANLTAEFFKMVSAGFDPNESAAAVIRKSAQMDKQRDLMDKGEASGGIQDMECLRSRLRRVFVVAGKDGSLQTALAASLKGKKVPPVKKQQLAQDHPSEQKKRKLAGDEKLPGPPPQVASNEQEMVEIHDQDQLCGKQKKPKMCKEIPLVIKKEGEKRKSCESEPRPPLPPQVASNEHEMVEIHDQEESVVIEREDKKRKSCESEPRPPLPPQVASNENVMVEIHDVDQLFGKQKKPKMCEEIPVAIEREGEKCESCESEPRPPPQDASNEHGMVEMHDQEESVVIEREDKKRKSCESEPRPPLPPQVASNEHEMVESHDEEEPVVIEREGEKRKSCESEPRPPLPPQVASNEHEMNEIHDQDEPLPFEREDKKRKSYESEPAEHAISNDGRCTDTSLQDNLGEVQLEERGKESKKQRCCKERATTSSDQPEEIQESTLVTAGHGSACSTTDDVGEESWPTGVDSRHEPAPTNIVPEPLSAVSLWMRGKRVVEETLVRVFKRHRCS